jgi:hypothetical protein
VAIRRRAARRRQSGLTMEQDFELGIGPRSEGSAFPSDEARRGAWEEHRAELIACDPVAYTDCWAARQYEEAPEDEVQRP